MKEKLRDSLIKAKESYCEFMSRNVSHFYTNYGFKHRVNEIDIFSEIILENFEFDEINLIETGVSGNINYGMFGFFLGALIDNFGGRMHSVDTDCETCKVSQEIFNVEFPNLKYKTHCQDSVEFLELPPIIPNLIHLDSYDFQLFDPFPSALHAWKEFSKIEKLIPKGAIVFIDDNWMKGTFLQWFENNQEYEKLITYPMIGKGVHIYQEVISNRINFDLIGNHHVPYDMIKIYIKKR